MYSAKRVKRDSPENIYRHCKSAGTCPPDVENKIEQNTLADRLLKIFGSIIYLGGLGIGSGRGTGAATGFRPLPEEVPLPETTVPTDSAVVPEAVRPTVRPRPSRPSTFGVPLDPISSAENIPRIVRPTEPAIVPLSEGGLPDPTVISTGVGPGEGVTDYEIFTNTFIDESLGAVGGHPTVTTGVNENIALLEITPVQQIPSRVTYATTDVDTGYTYIRSSLPADPDMNVFVDPRYSGTIVGDNIELEPITQIEEFEIQETEQPQTSTPYRVSNWARRRAQTFYNRFVQQMPTRNIDFLGQASRAVQFEFENPAFQTDVSLEFERDVQELAAAPDEAFTDVIRLSRPVLSETPGGNIRVSRLGTKGSMRTRSGTVLQQKVHYFYDLSPINTVEGSDNVNIESKPLGESSDILTIVDELSSGQPVNMFEHFNEDALLDIEDDSFQPGHLEIHTDELDEPQLIPSLIPDVFARTFVHPDLTDVLVAYPSVIDNFPFAPIAPVTPLSPVYLDAFGTDYYLHPSYLKRRKRKWFEIS
ncbi:L2 protein [Human papillomavirus type 211]|uniref:Minor capsid protein L2 n=1 Tax=Human papillomavirus type 211 TaxID=2060135 RepID=A0A2H4V8C2_9PAPI|nr:L2 protein [Human papillomavirus type 211]